MSKENNKYFNGLFPILFKKTETYLGKSIVSSQNIYLDNKNEIFVNHNKKNYLPNKKIFPKNQKKKSNQKRRECCIIGNEKINCYELFNDIWKAIFD